MRHRTTGVAVAAVAALALVASIQPALASERQAINAAVASSLTPANIAPGLGRYKPTFSGDIFRDYQSDWVLCSLRDPDRFVSFRGMDTEVRTFFAPRTAGSPQGVQQSQFLFSSARAAQREFDQLQRNAKQCTGSSTERFDGDDPGDSIEWQSTLSNGTMRAVANIATITVENDWNRALGGDVDLRQDEFSTYSRVGDAIIRVTYQRSPNGSLTVAERRAVRATTKAAIENYQRQAAPRAGSIQGRFANSTASLIEERDIPASLGSRKSLTPQDIRLTSGRDRIWLCDTEGTQFSDDAPSVPFAGITSNPVQVSSSYDRNRDGSISELILDFASAKRAERAFAQMRTQAKKCNGSFPEQIEGAGDGDGVPFSGVITRAFTTTEKKVTGSAPSIAIETQITSDIPAAGPATTSGLYQVLTLSGSRVVWVNFTSESPTTAKEKAGVEQLSVIAVRALRVG